MSIDWDSITLEELIDLCLKGDKLAWNQFFKRYTNLIKKQIIKVFVSRHNLDLARDKDIIRKIFLLVAEKLYNQNALDQLDNPLNLAAWLKSISKNKTRDWLDSYHTQKNLPEKQAEESSISFETPINNESDRTLQDTLKSQNQNNPEELIISKEQNKLGEVLKDMENLKEIELWALKLKVLFCDPLTEDEKREIASITNKAYDQIAEMIDKVMEGLLVKKQKKESDLGGAGRSWSLIRLLEARLREDLNSQNISDDERKEQEDKISRKSKRMETLMRSGNQPIVPTNEEVADILGIPKEQAGQVSVLVYRAREKLKSMKEKNKNPE